MANLQEIETKRQEMRKLGIANFSINGLPEDESLAKSIDESWSFFYLCVKDPYFSYKGKKGNMRFRIFQTLKDKPQIPMGYSGSPLFSFECFDGKPLEKAKEIIKSKVHNQYIYKFNDDEITCSLIIPEAEKTSKLIPLTEAKEGDKVFANWTCSNRKFKAPCEVLTVNRATFRVKLTEDVKTDDSYFNYKTRHQLVIPKANPTQYNCLTLI